MTLALEAVQKVYPNGYRAVNSLDLEVRDGEFFTLLGPSGCGKTTTLRMIAGLETPSTGRIYIGGRDLTAAHPRDRDVAMVFQSYALYPHMTARQNLVLNLEVKKMAAAQIEARLAEVTRMLGLEALLDKKPGQLSGGQRQRVALGRALIRRPNIFLMDEPLSNLDLKLRERTRTELKKLHETVPVTTVYVTHDEAEALVLSDRVGIMSAGDLVQVGTPQEVYDRPSSVFVAKFVGTPSINLIEVAADIVDGTLELRLASSGTRLQGARLPAEADVAARLDQMGPPLVLGVRPEAIALNHTPQADATPAVVEVVEPMGSVNHIVLRLVDAESATYDGDPLTAVLTSTESLATGSTTWLSLRPERLVLFDSETGKSLVDLSPQHRWQVA
jgi:ABC-type sugar transport system ATPase subunit